MREHFEKQSPNQSCHLSGSGQMGLTVNINHESETVNSIEPSESSLDLNCPTATNDFMSWHSIECWDPFCHGDFCYLNSWDGRVRASTLPHDLNVVETSELLPITNNDFTKCLEESLWGESSDDDCVVPSMSPPRPDLSVMCCNSETSSDGNQQYVLQPLSSDRREDVATVSQKNEVYL